VAVTLVTKSDQRQVAELEKLLKAKLDLEHLAFEDEKPRGRQNDGRRRWQGEETGDSRDEVRRERSERRYPERRTAAPADPFFDKPYEAPSDTSSEPAAWDQKARPARSGVSANIKPKRKVAALFKAATPSPEPTN
jgi:superfamily II DNA/RNA helicase